MDLYYSLSFSELLFWILSSSLKWILEDESSFFHRAPRSGGFSYIIFSLRLHWGTCRGNAASFSLWLPSDWRRQACTWWCVALWGLSACVYNILGVIKEHYKRTSLFQSGTVQWAFWDDGNIFYSGLFSTVATSCMWLMSGQAGTSKTEEVRCKWNKNEIK